MINYTELAISHLQLQTQKFMCFFLDLINMQQVACHENSGKKPKKYYNKNKL